MTEHLKTIPIADIVANPYQPRLSFDTKELMELAHSIKMNGLIQPVIVRKSDIFGYELIAGERRLRASQLAGLTTIPAVIKDISNKDSMHQAIVENLQRSNLNPIEEAKAFQNILEKEEMTHDQLAQYMGKSRPYISNSLRLLQLPKSIKEAIEKHHISSGHARALLAVTSKKEQENYFKQIISQNLSVRQTENLVKKKTNKKLSKIEKDIFNQAIENEIAKSLGLPIQLHKKNDGTGHIKLTFSNTEELNRIINKLK
ncbi:ParB/RepB/Spo0J family partition protein [Streptococcus parauberis]|uniref:ParB/RepB/Spo0J family partition protein n=1 Tax=Streptococcus parauberis TaxID=1348 RepID=UPI000C1456F7|nr:ParB/RepB/Spo0J family partition protein [Streptococcus parauberis]PIA86046.1 Chromosome-partitioning protein Spo0J [Streptococcus parauberis]